MAACRPEILYLQGCFSQTFCVVQKSILYHPETPPILSPKKPPQTRDTPPSFSMSMNTMMNTSCWAGEPSADADADGGAVADVDVHGQASPFAAPVRVPVVGVGAGLPVGSPVQQHGAGRGRVVGIGQVLEQALGGAGQAGQAGQGGGLGQREWAQGAGLGGPGEPRSEHGGGGGAAGAWGSAGARLGRAVGAALAVRWEWREPHPFVARWPWRFAVYHPGLAEVPGAVARWVSDIMTHQPPRWLSLLGPSGIGKTLVLRQALEVLRAAHEAGLWHIRTRTGRRGPQMAHIIPAEDLQDWRAPRDYAGYDVLYIEDIGAGADGGSGAGRVLRSRVAELLQLRGNRWTMLDANLHRGDIEQHLDGRIASRLRRDGSTCLELNADIPDFWG